MTDRKLMMKKWKLLRRFDIRDANGVYLRRWYLLETPWFGIFVHKIMTSDKDPDLHDHPWSFLSIMLWGGYDEQLGERWRGGYWVPLSRHDPKLVRRGWLSIGLRHAEDPHRITRLHRTPTWTLLFVGPRKREWGFYARSGWTHWKKYLGVK